MPTYTLQANIRNQRAAAIEQLERVFDHAETINMVFTGWAISAQGVVTITIQNAVPADQLAHLGLS